MGEIWKNIPSEWGYMASSEGRIMSPTGRILKLHKHLNYLRVSVLYPGSRVKHKRLVHRLVCEAFHGPCPSEAHLVAHWNDQGNDNRPANLRWATQKENMEDARRNGVSTCLTKEPSNEKGRGIASGNGRSAHALDGERDANGLPRVQRRAEEENRPMPERVAQAGRDRGALLPLRAQRGEAV